jgi:hypothetical protein
MVRLRIASQSGARLVLREWPIGAMQAVAVLLAALFVLVALALWLTVIAVAAALVVLLLWMRVTEYTFDASAGTLTVQERGLRGVVTLWARPLAQVEAAELHEYERGGCQAVLIVLGEAQGLSAYGGGCDWKRRVVVAVNDFLVGPGV